MKEVEKDDSGDSLGEEEIDSDEDDEDEEDLVEDLSMSDDSD